jgi:hypothetical protein
MLKSRLLMVAWVASCIALAVPALTQANPAPATQCGFVRASVPYTRHGHHDRWRVYVAGHASCASAKSVLDAVLHLDATAHNGSSNADSYSTYRNWICDFGQMGSQNCWQPHHRPYSAGALAVDCATASGGCPARVARSEVL